MTGIFGLASACILAAMAPLPAQAATGDGDWQWRATAYLWLPSLGGETSFPPSGGGPSIDVTGVWRYLDYDLGDSKPIKSIDFNGPALGVTFRF